MRAVDSANCCSRWLSSSSAMPAWSSGARSQPGTTRRRRLRQSSITHSCDSGDGLREGDPPAAQVLERASPRRGDRVETTASLAGLFNPATGNPPAVFHAIEQRIERRDVKRQHAARPRLDELVELIAVSALVLEEREHEKFCAAFLQVGSKHGGDICGDNVYVVTARRSKTPRGFVTNT